MLLLLIFGILITVRDCSVRCREDLRQPWSYRYRNGPLFWPKLSAGCAGQQQSPINIRTQLVQQDSNLQQFGFKNYDKPITDGEIENNGRTVILTPDDDVVRSIRVSNVEFRLQELHFHFGIGSDMGSEHAVNGQRFIMEGHLVHADSTGNFAVVGIFFEKTNSHKTAFQPIAEVLEDVRFRDQSTDLNSELTLSDMIPCDPCPIYRYNGSLTTPACTEGVIWSLVYPNMAKISRRELYALQGTFTASEDNREYKSCPMYGNFRNLQKLNNRIVTRSVRHQTG